MKPLSKQEIKARLDEIGFSGLEEAMKPWRDDGRAGVQQLLKAYDRKLFLYRQELDRLEKMRFYERAYSQYTAICGIDEAGRGPLAGPVVAGAVILPVDCEILYLNDSKQLSAKRREALYDEIMDKAVAASVGIVGPGRIDEINILQADYEAMRDAIAGLEVTPDLLLNDAVTIPQVGIRQIPIIKGDAKSLSIAAASIIAKVTRDRIMCQYDEIYPEYGFVSNKGYGSAAHIKALKEYGPCPIHRRSFISAFCS